MKTLSDKKINVWVSDYNTADVIRVEHIEQFIQDLKRDLKDPKMRCLCTAEIINRLAGDKLI